MIPDLRLKRAAPLSRRVTPFHRRWDWGRRLATSIISASHASVNDESEARRGRPGSGRPDDATANTLVLQDGRDPHPNPRLYRPGRICTRFTVVGAIRQAGSAASTVNRFLPAFQREIADNVGPLMHNDSGGAQ